VRFSLMDDGRPVAVPLLVAPPPPPAAASPPSLAASTRPLTARAIAQAMRASAASRERGSVQRLGAGRRRFAIFGKPRLPRPTAAVTAPPARPPLIQALSAETAASEAAGATAGTSPSVAPLEANEAAAQPPSTAAPLPVSSPSASSPPSSARLAGLRIGMHGTSPRLRRMAARRAVEAVSAVFAHRAKRTTTSIPAKHRGTAIALSPTAMEETALFPLESLTPSLRAKAVRRQMTAAAADKPPKARGTVTGPPSTASKSLLATTAAAEDLVPDMPQPDDVLAGTIKHGPGGWSRWYIFEDELPAYGPDTKTSAPAQRLYNGVATVGTAAERGSLFPLASTDSDTVPIRAASERDEAVDEAGTAAPGGRAKRRRMAMRTVEERVAEGRRAQRAAELERRQRRRFGSWGDDSLTEKWARLSP